MGLGRGTHSFSGGGSGISADDFPGLIDFEYDSLEVTSKTDDGPTGISFYEGNLTTLVATMTITYDVDGDIQTVVRTKV